jgi:hypothetical protein
MGHGIRRVVSPGETRSGRKAKKKEEIKAWGAGERFEIQQETELRGKWGKRRWREKCGSTGEGSRAAYESFSTHGREGAAHGDESDHGSAGAN